jgi:hypothetical protein
LNYISSGIILKWQETVGHPESNVGALIAFKFMKLEEGEWQFGFVSGENFWCLAKMVEQCPCAHRPDALDEVERDEGFAGIHAGLVTAGARSSKYLFQGESAASPRQIYRLRGYFRKRKNEVPDGNAAFTEMVVGLMVYCAVGICDQGGGLPLRLGVVSRTHAE